MRPIVPVVITALLLAVAPAHSEEPRAPKVITSAELAEFRLDSCMPSTRPPPVPQYERKAIDLSKLEAENKEMARCTQRVRMFALRTILEDVEKLEMEVPDTRQIGGLTVSAMGKRLALAEIRVVKAQAEVAMANLETLKDPSEALKRLGEPTLETRIVQTHTQIVARAAAVYTAAEELETVVKDMPDEKKPI